MLRGGGRRRGGLALAFVLWGGLVFAGAHATSAQETRALTLAEALDEARRGSPVAAEARARAEAARQAERAADAHLWPTVGADVGALRSNDPVAAFGGRLRQARFTQADFDPARLNRPDALTDWSAGLSVGWAPLDLSARAGRVAAGEEADAAALGAGWAERSVAFRAEALYLEAVAAQRGLGAADAALSAAEASVTLMERRREEGLLTDADVLRARAALEGARAARIDAARRLADARGRLGVALGWPADVVPLPTDTAFAARTAPRAEGTSAEARADLRASALGVRAAEARALQASRIRLPRVEGFARLETHAPNAFDGLQDDWTVGVRLSVPLFTGFRVDAERRAAASVRDAARRAHENRLLEAEAQVAEARRALDAADRGANAARAASSAADEASRLVRRRFEEGLATTADLLSAQAEAAAHAATAVRAELMHRLAAARLAYLTDDTAGPGGLDR